MHSQHALFHLLNLSTLPATYFFNDMSFDTRKGKHRNKSWILIKGKKLRLFNLPQIAKGNVAL
jgi:hypothetical protein